METFNEIPAREYCPSRLKLLNKELNAGCDLPDTASCACGTAKCLQKYK